MIVFGREPLATVWNEMIALARLHWAETDMAASGEIFAPSYERYAQYRDTYMVFTVRDEGRLVGHCGMYLVASMHSQKLLATEDTWYLLPEYRKGRNAIRFYHYVEAAVTALGAEKITMTAAPYNGACRIMEYLGYKLDCYKYSRDLTSPPKRLSSESGADSAMTNDTTVMEKNNVCTIPTCNT